LRDIGQKLQFFPQTPI